MSDERILTTRRQCCLGLMAMLAAGCSTGESRPSLISAQKERELGQEAASEVERTVGLVQDPALVGYVSEIGRRLVAHTSTPDAPYQFHVADDAEPNAFALPGGFVYVTRGLLALANMEDELAGVMGHEIGHVAARHSVRHCSHRPDSRFRRLGCGRRCRAVVANPRRTRSSRRRCVPALGRHVEERFGIDVCD